MLAFLFYLTLFMTFISQRFKKYKLLNTRQQRRNKMEKKRWKKEKGKGVDLLYYV